MGPLSGRGARLGAACVLLSVAAGSWASPAPGASPAGAGAQGSVSGPHTLGNPIPSASASPVRMSLPPSTYIIPTTPVPKGCLSGTVAITHRPAEAEPSAFCIKAGARLRLTLVRDPDRGWDPLQVTPPCAATVTSTTDPTAVHAIAVFSATFI